MHLDRTARRVLGSLVEKRLSTPDQYPLTMNALVLACNQHSNREPVMHMQDFEVSGCILGLRQMELATVVEREGGRTVRYQERLTSSIGLSDREAAILAELMLRGPQTEQELAKRCPRMTPVGTTEEVVSVLQGLAGRRLVEHLPRGSGQRIARWRHLLTPPDEAPEIEHEIAESTTVAHATHDSTHPVVHPIHDDEALATLRADVAALRAETATLRAEVTALRDEVAALRGGG